MGEGIITLVLHQIVVHVAWKLWWHHLDAWSDWFGVLWGIWVGVGAVMLPLMAAYDLE